MGEQILLDNHFSEKYRASEFVFYKTLNFQFKDSRL